MKLQQDRNRDPARAWRMEKWERKWPMSPQELVVIVAQRSLSVMALVGPGNPEVMFLARLQRPDTVSHLRLILLCPLPTTL
jgi:hypothetical protein